MGNRPTHLSCGLVLALTLIRDLPSGGSWARNPATFTSMEIAFRRENGFSAVASVRAGERSSRLSSARGTASDGFCGRYCLLPLPDFDGRLGLVLTDHVFDRCGVFNHCDVRSDLSRKARARRSTAVRFGIGAIREEAQRCLMHPGRGCDRRQAKPASHRRWSRRMSPSRCGCRSQSMR
jgi:hypothetical protein